MLRRATTVSLLALGFGCLLLAGSVAFVEDLPRSGQQLYWMTVTPVEMVSSTDSVLTYSELPPVIQKAFDAARQNEPYDLWSETDRDVLEMLRDHEYIRHEGQYYRYEDLDQGLDSDFVFSVYRLIEPHKGWSAYERKSSFSRELRDRVGFVSKEKRDPDDRESRARMWMGLAWTNEAVGTITEKLAETDESDEERIGELVEILDAAIV